MIAATAPRDKARDAKMLVVRGTKMVSSRTGDLARELSPGDLVVLNDAATLPGVLRGTTARGEPIEARLAAHVVTGSRAEPAMLASRAYAEDEIGRTMLAVLFGAGDVATRTEDRGPPPRVRVGDVLRFHDALRVEVVAVSEVSPRLCTLRFLRARAVSGIFEVGTPVQYAYIARPLSLHHVTPRFSSEPWAFEPASAGLTLDFRTLATLRARGVEIATVTHAAGLSSLGDAALDRELPFPELSRVSAETADSVRRAKARGGRVVAVGTTVTRALESAAVDGARLIAARAGLTSLRLGERYALRVVDAVLTGVHAPGESHHELLTAFQPRAVLTAACEAAEREGYLGHELGDAMLVFGGGTRDARSGGSET